MNDPETRLLSIGHNVQRGHWHIGSHQHQHYEMIVVTGGFETINVMGRRIKARAGDVVLFKPGVPHEEWSGMDDPVQTYFLSFQWPGDPSTRPLQTVDEDGRLRLLSAWLFAGRDDSLAATRQVGETFFRALIGEFVRLQGRHENPLVASVRGFVRQNIGTALTVDMLARHAGMSKFHFIRRFRRLAGRSPMEEVRMIRIGHARDMILTSNLPLKAIAPMAGLGDEISLYRLFRRYLHMTPGQLRRTVRG